MISSDSKIKTKRDGKLDQKTAATQSSKEEHKIANQGKSKTQFI